LNLIENTPYNLSIQVPGLKPFLQSNISIEAGQTRRMDIALALVSHADSVTIIDYGADARGNSAEISQVIAAEQVNDLPSLNRNVARFALLDPHVRQALGRGADPQDGNRLSINAGSYRNTAYILDGTNVYDWTYAVTPQEVVPLGSVSDMKILTGGYSAEYGTSTTGIIVATTRSGTDDFHGEAFGYLRPSGIQARPPLAPFHVPNMRHDWGLSAGGPIKRDRAWFFGDFERGYQERGSLIQSPVVTFFDGESWDYAAMLRADVTLNNANSLTWRLNGNHFSGNDVNDRISGFTQPSAGRYAKVQAWGTQISEQYSHSNLVNRFHLSFVDYVPDSAFPLDSSVSVVRPNYATTGYSTVNWVHVNSYDAGDAVTLSLNRQQIHVGFDFIRQTAHDYSYTPFGTYTYAPGPPQESQVPLRYAQTFGVQDIHYGQTALQGYVSDEIRLSRRLTATAGLRYEYQSITDSRANFGPRLAMAWDVRGDGKTIVRGGFGIFYDQLFMYVSRRFITLGPDAPTETVTIPYGTPGFPVYPNSLPAPLPGTSAGKLNIYLPADTLSNPYNLQFTGGVQQQIGRDFTLSIDGQHSHTLKQFRVNDINHPTPFIRTGPGQVRPGAAADATRPYTTYDGVPVRDVAVIENSASSIYDALDLGITKRFGSRFQLAAHYVLSSSASYSMFYADANRGIPNEWNNWGSAERAPSDFFQHNRFSGNAFVRLPLKVDLSLVSIAASGLPVNPITGVDNNGDTYTVDRPVAFGRNSFRGPIEFSLDTALSRRVNFTERLSAEFRAECSNIVNKNNYVTVNNIYGQGATPLSTFLAPIAGIANTDPSRQFRLGIRLVF
jgi:hypothetical protein